MQKLDKPVELEGRVIQYTVNVHLKKKSSTTKTSKKISNKLRGGRIEDNGYLEANDFIYPVNKFGNVFATKIKNKNKFFGRKQTCFFITPIKLNHENMYYKYAVYYSYKDNNIIIKIFDGTIAVEQIDIKDIPHDKDGYDFLKTLLSILPSYPDESQDFIKKVEEEFTTRQNPYVEEFRNMGYKRVINLTKKQNPTNQGLGLNNNMKSLLLTK